MVDAVLVVLDVTVQHGGIRPEAELVGSSCGIEPFRAVDLVIADDVTNSVGEDLRTTTGHGVDARGLHSLEGFANGHLAALGQEGNLDHRERLDVDLRKALFEAANEIHEVLKGQVGMESTDDMELGDGFSVASACSLPGLFKRHGVSACLALLAAEGAETAGGNADVRRVDVPVDVEVSDVSVEFFADVIGEPTDSEDVAATIERHAVVEAEPHTGEDLLGNRAEGGVIGLKRVTGPRDSRFEAHTMILSSKRCPAAPLIMELCND